MNYSGACSPAGGSSSDEEGATGSSSDEGANVGWVGLGLLIG